jgi:PAS domain S-box-containing protein
MHAKSSPRPTLHEENLELRAQLDEAEETLRAMGCGQVDAPVAESVDGRRVHAPQGQDAEANRFRGEILAQVSDAVIACDNEQRVTYLNAAAERLYGIAASRSVGLALSEIYESRWLRPEDAAEAAAALRERGQWRGEKVHVRRDGRALNVESSVTALREIAGRATGTLAVIRDMTERKQHEDKLRTSEIRYRRLFETADDGILILDPVTHEIIDANPFIIEVLGCPYDRLVGRQLFEIGLFEDRAASEEMLRRLTRTRQVRYEDLPLESQAGRRHDVELVASLYDQNGSQAVQCSIRDVTERKRSENHVKQLMAEVNHRAKNLLAVVQAVAYQTARHGDPATLAERLSDRIDGLAAGHDLLVKNEWQGVEVAELVAAQLAHFKDLIGMRVLIEGPRARLKIGAAQGVGMALHELATNAAKYGALSNLEGRVRVGWGITYGAEPAFSMSWLEDGGPRVTPPTRKGFGQTVIGRMAGAAVGGAAEIVFREEGLLWRLSAPVENALAPTGTI